VLLEPALATQLFGIKETLAVLKRDNLLAASLTQHKVGVLGVITHHEVAVVLVLADDVIGRGRRQLPNAVAVTVA
jgi:hypothetical protein